MNTIKELIQISQYAGMREDLVQAGGGNTSIKIDKEQMLIKASGYQLTEITAESGYSTINYRLISSFLKKNQNQTLTEEQGNKLLKDSLIDGERPSIETFLHAITDVLTLHTHPIVVNILTTRNNGMGILQNLFPDALIVGYKTPGIQLVQECLNHALQKEKNCKIIFLKNHGMIITGKTSEEVISKTENVLHIIENYLDVDMTAQHNSTALWRAFSAAGQKGIVWRVTDANILHAYQEFHGLWSHEFCPDCLVYCGKSMLQLADDENIVTAIRQHIAINGPVSIVEWKGAIYIHSSNTKKAMEIQSVLSFSAQVMLHNKQQECDFLSEAEQNFLLCWDAEKYRQSLQN